MILRLQAGNVTILASEWSAGADPGGRVNIRAHGGVVGLKIAMEEFLTMVSITHPANILNLASFCEDPVDTQKRLARGG